MNSNPLVSITIPTFNSERFLKKCLKALKNQSYKNIEINIVDGGSSDNTIEIAKENDVRKIIIDKKSLLSARYLGVVNSRGEYVLLLDSDQIIGKNTIRRALKGLKEKNLSMLILGEDVYSSRTLLQKLYKMDKKLVHRVVDLNPYTSVLLPRFYNRKFLLKVFRKIPQSVIDEARPQDHAIIYLESWNLDRRTMMINNCIKHIEPEYFIDFFKKFCRWGYYSNFENPSPYQDYFNKRTLRLRNGVLLNGFRIEGLASIILLLLKGFPYKLGNYFAKIKSSVNNRFPDR